MAKKAVKKATKKSAAKTAKKKVAKKTTAKKKVVKKATKKVAKKAVAKKAVAKKKTVKKAVKSTAKKTVAPKKVKAAQPKKVVAEKPKPKIKPMSAKDLEYFRKLLLEKRSQMFGDVSALQTQAFGSSETAGDQSRMPVHMADIGSDNFEHEFTLGLIEGEQAVLREIEEALERIELGTYGSCLATGKPIGKARLKAKPWAKYCYEYTLELEKHKRTGY